MRSLMTLLLCGSCSCLLFRAHRAASAFGTTILTTSSCSAAAATSSSSRRASNSASAAASSYVGSRSFAKSAIVRQYQLSSKVNGEEDNSAPSSDGLGPKEGGGEEGGGTAGKIPQTGWNHNLPAESSKFWQSSEDAAVGEVSGPSEQEKRSGEVRTGWLHNTQAPEQRRRRASGSGGGGGSSAAAGTSNKARKRLERAMKEQEQNHRILCVTFHPCGGEGGSAVVVTEHKLSVPLRYDHDTSKTDRLDVYFTVVEKAATAESRSFFQKLAGEPSPRKRASSYVQRAALKSADKLCLYLQGGPGFGAPAPVSSLGFSSPDASWAAKVLSMSGTFERVVLMDQRGTGRSTPVTRQYLEKAFPDLFLLDEAAGDSGKNLGDFEASHPEESARVQGAVEKVADYLSQLRADNIVRDAESIKDVLLQPPPLDGGDDSADGQTKKEEEAPPARPWGCALGQSFGGFCLMTYLSQIEHPPSILLLTGGIAPMLTPVYDVYTKLWDMVKERSLRYYEMYPEDKALVKLIVRKLSNDPVQLPSGGTLTARRFLQLGLALGGSPSAFASLHALFSSALLDPGCDDESEVEFTRAFLKSIEMQQSFDDHPIYYWLHEAIYADGSFNVPTDWAAHRAYLDKVKANPEFDYSLTRSASDDRPVLFFGEMVFPWMAEDYSELRGVGLSEVANALAQKTDWEPLFDRSKMRAALVEDEKCKAAAAVYHEDMYVEFDACTAVAARDGPLEKCKLFVTNEYQHSGLRDAGSSIFAKLYGMATGSIRTPS